MQLRERAPVVVSIVIAAAATATLATAAMIAADTAFVHHCNIQHEQTSIDLPAVPSFEHRAARAPDPILIDTLTIPAADAAYRRHAFGEAARIARTCAEADPRLSSTAELYWQFANAYYTGFDPGGPVTKRYEALREAKKLDVVLGAQFVDEIEHRLAELTPKAAIAYAARREYDDAALACAVADSLGLYDDPNVQAVRRKLHAEHYPR